MFILFRITIKMNSMETRRNKNIGKIVFTINRTTYRIIFINYA